MDYHALTKHERDIYEETVAGSHHREVELLVLTLDGDPVTSLTNAFLGGSIQGDVSRTPCEVLETDVIDDEYVLDWTNGEHRKHMLRVVDSRFIPELDEWVETVSFTGPLWDFERNGPVVSLVAHGSERLGMGSVRRVFHRPRKARATDVIVDLLRAAGANSKDLSIPRLKATLPERVTVGINRGKKKDDDKGDKQKPKRPKRREFRADSEDSYWPEAERIAHALGRELFPDGRGRFCLRAPMGKPIVDFTRSTLLAAVTEKRPEDGEVPNTWIVVGANPKGPRGRIEVEVTLPARHPLSAESLAWNGTPRKIIERIENKHIHTVKKAREVGQRKRDRALRETVEYEVEALPVVAWLRPNTMVSIPTNFGRVSTRARQWTIPLGPDADPLTIGANRRRKRRSR